MSHNTFTIYVKIIASGKPTDFDPVGCDGMFIESKEICTKEVVQLEDENEALRGFIAIVLCWKPEWAQTSYFQRLSEGQRNDLLELAKSTKHEGSGGIDDEWLYALLKGEENKDVR